MKKHVLIVSNLYPNRDEPNRGIFIKQLTDDLNEEFDISVICPIPWRPILLQKVKGAKTLPNHESINGIDVYYPRHFVFPKTLRFTYGWFMYLALLPMIKLLHAKKNIDLISAHWVYPDGFGAVKVAKKMGLPVTVHALGCDINEYTKYPLRRSLIAKTLVNSDRVVVKSADLAKRSMELGSSENKVKVVLNGVDQKKFIKMDVKLSRDKLGLASDAKYLLFVGNIQEEKGLIHLIRALPLVKRFDATLLVVGSGPQSRQMQALVGELNLTQQVKFVGAVPHHEVPLYLNSANALCLPSLREGCPNIVLEALSCGTPVLASDVGAVSQIITDNRMGVVVPAQSSEEIALAIPEVLELKEKYSVNFKWYSWKENADRIGDIFNELLA